MANSGCNFLCDNEKCNYYNTGFVLTSPWPLGDIELVINDINVVKNNDLREQLIRWKLEGRKYARINMPNIHKIPTLGYRTEMWCDKCPCAWSYDFITVALSKADKDDKELEDLIKDARIDGRIPNNCEKCNAVLKTFSEVLEDGIYCPSCKEKLAQSTWFSNEEE